jgi:hypothetical protein
MEGKNADASPRKHGSRYAWTPEEKIWLAELVSTIGLSISEYVRRRFFGDRTLVPRSDEWTVRELRRLGGLLKHNFEIFRQWDAAVRWLSKDDLDRYGRELSDKNTPPLILNAVSLCLLAPRPLLIDLTDFLKKTDRFANTIVFCEVQEHASEMRAALGNLDADLVQEYSDYVSRVTADEGDIGRGHM